ncbi:MAG: hypothetical protein NTY19_43950 [Planctomycetota bacterium]|nr:hypothetical protein [Planctomycetota bacterium]
MDSTALPRHELGTVTLELERGGRRYSPYPQSQDAPSRPPQSRIRKLQQRQEEAELPELLREAIWNRLAWCTASPDGSERQPFVEAYVRSLNQLGQFRQDVEDLVREACRANLEFRQAGGTTNVIARDAVLSAKLNEMLVQAACDWLPARNILDGPLVSQPVSIIRSRLETALADAVSEFVKQFSELLAKLVERQLFGLVEWLPNQCCCYHFFKSVVIQENEGASRRIVSEEWFDGGAQPDSETRPDTLGKRTIEETRGHGTHAHRFARHEHALMNAVHTTIRNSRVVMPPQVARFVDRVPEWLYPFVEVIDGDIVRERIIEQDIKVENWADVSVYDEPISGRDPGVVVGPYVLTGWGPREVQQEQGRRQMLLRTSSRELVRDTACHRAKWFVAGTVAMTLVALLLIIQSLRGGGGALFAVLATAAAIGSVWQAAFDFATARGSAAAAVTAHRVAATIGPQILLAEWLVTRWFQPMTWVTPVALVMGAILSHTIGRRFE